MPARLVARLVAVLAAGALAASCSGSSGTGSSTAGSVPTGSDQQRAVTDARTFLHEYVDPTGRVVRRDQGGDTVSEGQGYGLLLAVAMNDRADFGRIWSWTTRNLQLRSGLFAYHWPGHSAADRTPASDADTQIAWALALAGQRWNQPSYTAAAKRIAGAVANAELGYDDQGHPTLSGGPWAVPHGQPVTVEPGYWTYPADAALAALTGDQRWQSLAGSDAQHLTDLTNSGAQLPADWAQLGGGHPIIPIARPAGSTVGSGEDGMRALVWADCTATTRGLEAKWWGLLQPTAGQAPLTRSLSGAPASSDQAPLAAVAAAAAAGGSGNSGERDQLLNTADRLARKFPTYYGTAWVALGRVLLTTGLLTGDCEAG